MFRNLKPGAVGSYVLILHLETATRLAVGAMGTAHLPAGYYAYCGSAMGSGGLKARVGRHIRGNGPLFWHIDYLRSIARPVAVWARADRQRREHLWARALARWPRANQPFAGFGASDCTCRTHLFQFSQKPVLRSFSRQVRLLAPSHPQIRTMYACRDDEKGPA